ncbi:recombinase family protein [Lentibacter sp. XHP0401]|uniref:recombinase family protein n=1 Tax=Lentibacter sp. XHP0401 TaxID=2984334 RepID=UPI0021E8DBC0|nr:recombinase family protein [Lentibacter sp. XHP0401]MCV2894621.1 recombinase family protein [Lentibacter sp. XHP0401]
MPMTKRQKRAAIYARFSTDMQTAASIDDQIRVCTALAGALDLSVARTFRDDAISGSTDLRPGFQGLIQAAMSGQIDVVIAESLDRLSRDLEHISGFFKRMQFLGVEIVTKAEGTITDYHIGLGGTMNALFLKNLAQKTHHGLEGRVKAGKSAGGKSYGYDIHRSPLPDGTFTTGELKINETEADIVRRIFVDYASGLSARSIATALNQEGIPAPRAATWSFSTISGNWKRGTGILNNDLYIGERIWNRQRFVKCPQSGKRQALPNPPEDWVREAVPELRIIDQELWDQVKARQGATRSTILEARTDENGPQAQKARRARYLLSGTVECGDCGAGYIMISADRLGCSAARNRGTCQNRKSIKRLDLEERVLCGLRERLMTPEMISTFVETYQEESRKEHRAAKAARANAGQELTKVTREIDNIVEAISQGMFQPSMKAKMDELEARKAQLEGALSALPEEDTVLLHPGLADLFRKKVEDLVASLNDPGLKTQAGELLRSLIDTIILTPDSDAPNGHLITLQGELAGILSFCDKGMAVNADARSNATGARQLTMVAGARFGHYFAGLSETRIKR